MQSKVFPEIRNRYPQRPWMGCVAIFRLPQGSLRLSKIPFGAFRQKMFLNFFAAKAANSARLFLQSVFVRPFREGA